MKICISWYKIYLCALIMIHSIFFDIDGTLVSFKTHTIPPSAEAVNRCRERGIRIFLCTKAWFWYRFSLPEYGGLLFDGLIAKTEAIVKTTKDVSSASV